MARVRYTGTADERVIEEEDFARTLQTPHETVSWNRLNHYSAEMSDEVAQTLVALLPDEFEVLDRDDEVPDQPEESPVSPQVEGNTPSA